LRLMNRGSRGRNLAGATIFTEATGSTGGDLEASTIFAAVKGASHRLPRSVGTDSHFSRTC
jgi:hypothetical protein